MPTSPVQTPLALTSKQWFGSVDRLRTGWPYREGLRAGRVSGPSEPDALSHPPSAAPPSGPRPRGWPLSSQAGFTLIEVLVTALIVILLGAASARALISTSHASGDQRFRSQADSLASQDQERLRGLSDDALNGLSQNRPVTLGGTAFNVQSVATYLDTTGTSTCTTTSAAYYKTVSTVTWTENFSNRPATITEESVLSRPVSGSLLVQVNDQTGQLLSGVSVSASGPDTQTSLTDSNGCTLFAGLTPGSYAVTLADLGYVDPNGNASPPNATATVNSTGSASPAGLPFHLGLAGSIVGTFTTYNALYPGQADAISWLGSGAAYGMSGGDLTAPPTSPAITQTTGRLFPFNQSITTTPSYTSNYAVWGGQCLQQEPPSGYDRFSVTPGSIGQAQSVREPLLALTSVKYTNGTTTTVKPDHVRLTFVPTAPTGSTCMYSWTPTITAATTMPAGIGWLANPGQPFASTVTTGATASASSNSTSPQAGYLTVCVDYLGYKATSPAPVVNSSMTAANVVPAITIIKQVSSLGTC